MNPEKTKDEIQEELRQLQSQYEMLKNSTSAASIDDLQILSSTK